MEKKAGLPAAGGATYVELWRRLIIQNIQLYLPSDPHTGRSYPHVRTPTRNPKRYPDRLEDVIDRKNSNRL